MRALLAVLLCAAACNPGSSGQPGDGGPDGGALDGGHPTPRAGFAAAWQVADGRDLIGGPSTKGRVGDFEIANARVRFLVEGAHPSDGYDPYGCAILAADRQRPAGEPGESRFGEIWMGFNFRAPGCDRLSVVNDGSDGEPAQLHAEGRDEESPFMASLFGASAQPVPLQATIFRDYFLSPDSDALLLNLTLRNDSASDLFLRDPYIGMAMNRGLRHWVDHSGFDFDFSDLARVNSSAEFYAAVGERVSYSVYNTGAPFSPILNFAHVLIGQYPQQHIPPGQAITFRFIFGVGTGDTGSLQVAHAAARGGQSDLVPLSGAVVDGAGLPIANARVHVTTTAGDQAIAFARTGPDGAFSAPVRQGNYGVVAVADDRAAAPASTIAVPTSGLRNVRFVLGARSRIDAAAVDDLGAGLPAKIVLEPRDNLRPQLPAPLGEPAPNAPVIVFSADGRARVPVFPGRWTVTFSRGFEYDRPQLDVSAPAGGFGLAGATLHRVVDTRGWLSGDFHVHAQFSPDGEDLLAEKVRAFAAEGVAIPVSTEHEFIGDFGPTVRDLGLGAFMHAVPGTELTTTATGHFNIFPLTPLPMLLNQGAFNWYGRPVPQVLAEARRRLTADELAPIVQMNHPRATGMAYLDAVHFDPNTFAAQADPGDFTTEFDSMEVWNGVPLEKFEGCPAPQSPMSCNGPSHPTAFDWFSFLDRRRLIAATGNSDSHRAALSEVGYPRNYLFVGGDDPAAASPPSASPDTVTDAQLLRAIRGQRVTISGGPFVTAQVAALGPAGTVCAKAAGIGGTACADNSTGEPIVHLKLDVQAPQWMGPLSRIDVWVGDKSAAGAFIAKTITLNDPATAVHRFTRVEDIRLRKPSDTSRALVDTFVVVTVRGPVDSQGLSSALWPVIERPLPPFAITNPIWIDTNGDGVLDPLK